MSKIIASGSDTLLTNVSDAKVVSRRRFLGYTSAAAAFAMVFASCDKNDNDDNDNGINLGSGDGGILNYAYALEQLEAAFYTQVILTPFAGITAAQTALLTDIRDHEIAHAAFFKEALGSNAIQDLTPDFSGITFTNKDSVLGTAKAFEDLGVAAYNGAGKLISTSTQGKAYLGLAGKIVSVEARHAAYIRDLISNGSFADNTVVDADGLDQAFDPPQVLTIANNYLVTKISGRNLPTS